MSDCPYKFALHPGIIYGGPAPEKECWADLEYVNFDNLRERYELCKKDCIQWNLHHASRSSGWPWHKYVHLYPPQDRDYAAALIRAILRYENVKNSRENCISGMSITGVIIDEG